MSGSTTGAAVHISGLRLPTRVDFTDTGLEAGTVYTDNVYLVENNKDDDFITGKREQDPIYSAEAHLIRRFRPGFWASLDANYFTGGRQTIGGDPLRDVQSNRRFGGTLMVPFAGRHAIKVGYSIGTRTRYGDDFRKLLVAYQVLLS